MQNHQESIFMGYKALNHLVSFSRVTESDQVPTWLSFPAGTAAAPLPHSDRRPRSTASPWVGRLIQLNLPWVGAGEEPVCSCNIEDPSG